MLILLYFTNAYFEESTKNSSCLRELTGKYIREVLKNIFGRNCPAVVHRKVSRNLITAGIQQ